MLHRKIDVSETLFVWYASKCPYQHFPENYRIYPATSFKYIIFVVLIKCFQIVNPIQSE